MGDNISREAATKILCEACGNAACARGAAERCSYYTRMQNIPAANAQPVARGEWLEWWPGNIGLIMTGEEMLWMCSECGAKFAEREDVCPYCGVDMRPWEADERGSSLRGEGGGGDG